MGKIQESVDRLIPRYQMNRNVWMTVVDALPEFSTRPGRLHLNHAVDLLTLGSGSAFLIINKEGLLLIPRCPASPTFLFHLSFLLYTVQPCHSQTEQHGS